MNSRRDKTQVQREARRESERERELIEREVKL